MCFLQRDYSKGACSTLLLFADKELERVQMGRVIGKKDLDVGVCGWCSCATKQEKKYERSN